MKTQIAPKVPADFDLTQLGKVALDAHHGRILEIAQSTCGGLPMWCNRKLTEGHNVLALAQLSQRFAVVGMDLREDFRAHLMMRVPVPCLPDPTSALRIAPVAELGLVYPAKAVVEPQPGYSFVWLLNPWHVWHPNIGPISAGQRICLGPTLPAGVQVREIIFLVYRALTLQSAQMNAWDSAGVMNGAAADWWQRNADKIPLTKENFMCPSGRPQ